ncbi:MAG: PQQ-binding-like beta-propeller repeat protein, partial [Bauldia sp.]
VPDTLRDELIEWIRGADRRDIDADGNTTEARRQIGDPLHARPVAVEYGSSAEDPDTVVFVSTNDGFLHAVDAQTGVEVWSYVPGRLLARQYELYLDQQSTVRRYGLDGEIRLFRGTIDGNARKVLVFGMGRGGDAVFAIDVTVRNAPRLLWQIDSSTAGFASLGRVWAAPPVVRMDIGGQRPVVVLSGGYDDSQDNRGYRTDNVGNALFFVDLETGAKLWSAGPDGHDLDLPSMQHSIPAAPRVLDVSGDGLADRLYVGDVGGRLWRFDVINGNSAASLVEGGVLASLGAADLGASPPASEIRRFYVTPDAVLVDCIDGTFLALNIGSGYLGHPLDTDVEDAFFSVRDPNLFAPIATAEYPEPITAGELLDITDDPTAEVPVDARGWRLRMVEDAGEKILRPAITFDNTTFFNSFAPSAQVSACAGGLGVNRGYVVDACNGNPVNNLDGSTEPGPLGTSDRFRQLSQTGIAPEPSLLLLDMGGRDA